MSEEEKLQLENECLMKYSKAQMIQKYIDELEESSKLSELWCKSQQENKQLIDNWNYIKKMLKEAKQEKYISGYCGTCTDVDIDFLLNKMQELQGSDSNE